LIDAHGGQIAVSCPASGGTTVTIDLPARAASAAAAAAGR